MRLIQDSYHWKRRLHHELKTLRRSLKRPNEEREYDAIEWFIFTTAFIVRKLNASHRLSYEAASRTVPVEAFRARRGKAFHPYDEGELADRFDFGSGKRRSLGIEALCNQLIHSYDFIVAKTGGTGRVIFFNSDRSSESALFAVRLRDYVRFIEYLITDDWGYIVRRDPNDVDKMYALRMRRQWSKKRIDDYFAKYGLPPMYDRSQGR